MNMLDRAIGVIAPGAALRRVQARRTLAAITARAYDAGRPSRATAGWRRPFTSSRSETYVALPYLRASAHDIARNNPHGAKIIADLTKDLVGTGIVPRAATGSKRLNRQVDAVAAEFFRTMDADGTTSNYAGFQTLMGRAFFEGGEAVTRRFIRPSRDGLLVPLQFSLMEGELVDNSRNFVTPEGNRVIQGVEIDPTTRRRIAYWMFSDHPGDSYIGTVEGSLAAFPVPAADVRILMEPQRPGQLRGTPWITPILVRAKLLDDYEDAERQRKRTESSVPLIVKNAPGQVNEASDGGGASLFPTMIDADGRIVEVVEPGLVAYLRDSAGIESIHPAEAASFAAYKRAELQSLAAGARSTYEIASGDLSQTSYSSIQFGTLSYRGMIDALRATRFIPELEWIWRCMIDAAIAVGRLPPNTSYRVEHHCPPWLPIDPEKAANADKTAIRTGTKSLYEVVTARGKDFDDHLAEIARSNKGLDRYDLVLDSDPRHTDLRGIDQMLAAEAKGPVPPTATGAPDDAAKSGAGSDVAAGDGGDAADGEPPAD